MYSTRTKVLIRSKDRTSGSSHNFDATLPQRIKDGSYQLRHVGIPASYYNITDSNNEFKITITQVAEIKGSTIITNNDLAVSINPGLYNNITYVLNELLDKLVVATDGIGVQIDMYEVGTSLKIQLWVHEPATIAVDVTSSLAKFLGFTVAHASAQTVISDVIPNLIRTKYVSIDFNSTDQYSEMKYGAPLSTFIVPLLTQSGTINYAPVNDFHQGITFNQDITNVSIRLLDEDGKPLDLNLGGRGAGLKSA